MVLRRVVGVLVVVAVSTSCASTSFDSPLSAPTEVMSGDRSPSAQVWVDEENRAVVVVAGPFHVPAADAGTDHTHGAHGTHHESMKSPLVPLVWPVDQDLQGFRLAAYRADGTELPRGIMHHMIGVNFDRRQLIYPIAERLFGFGTETPDVKLPDFFAVPLEIGDSIGMYAMWNNDTGEDLHDVYMQVVLPYSKPGSDPEAVMPIYMDTNNEIGGKTSFDLPPGRSVRSYEFTLPVNGGLLAAGGHLHDYGVELRLEDAWSGDVLVELDGIRESDGRLDGVEQKVFRAGFGLIDRRIELEAGRPYRVVGTYFNPTDETIPDGGMAHIVGLFAPDEPAAWPDLDRTAVEYAADIEALPPPLAHSMMRHGTKVPIRF